MLWSSAAVGSVGPAHDMHAASFIVHPIMSLMSGKPCTPIVNNNHYLLHSLVDEEDTTSAQWSYLAACQSCALLRGI